MIIESSSALILHKRKLGESSAQVLFFTAEWGLIQCQCKGWNTKKKQPLLESFTPLWAAFVSQRDRHYVKTIESTGPRFTLLGDSLFAALYVNELLYLVLKPLAADLALFEAYYQTLGQLSRAKDKPTIESALRRFEWALLTASGYGFSWTSLAESGAAIESNAFYRFVVGEGFMPSETGILGAHLLAIAKDQLESAETLLQAKLIMRQAIHHLLGGRTMQVRTLYRESYVN